MLEALVDALERDRGLREPARLRERGRALERLDIHRGGAPSMPVALHRRIETLCADLEAIDARLQRRLRRAIQRGAGAPALLALARAARDDAPVPGDSYDHLDTLVGGILAVAEPGDPLAGLAEEMVFYQPTPARHVFEVLERTGLGERDVLVDLGSGLGQVPLLAATCTGARCVGIEWEPAYVECARRRARALRLGRVDFVQSDARAADLSSGTVFYLYTPFKGQMLREVLDRLRAEAGRREIRVVTLGPCTATVARESWLRADGAWETHRPAVFRGG